MDADQPLEEQAKELHDKVEQADAEATNYHEELLEAAKEGEDLQLEETETVELGQVEIEAKTDIPGKVARKLDTVMGANVKPGRVIDTYVDILTRQTEAIETDYGEGAAIESESDIRGFWTAWLEDNDIQSAGTLALERVVKDPANLEEERREQAMQSFPADRQSGDSRPRR